MKPTLCSLCAAHKPTISLSHTLQDSSTFLHHLPLPLFTTIQTFPNLLKALRYFPPPHPHQMTSSPLSQRKWKSSKRNFTYKPTYMAPILFHSCAGGGVLPPSSPCVLEPILSHLLRSPTLSIVPPLSLYPHTSS